MGDSKLTKISFPKLAIHWLVYAAFRCIEFFLWLLPIEVIWYLGRAMGILGYYVSGKYRQLALRNLRIAFGREKDLAWQKATARKHFASLLGNILCGFKLPMMNQKDVEARVTVEGMEHTHAAMSKNRPILYLVCHLSCWEILTQVPNLFVFDRKPATIYQPLRNPFLNALMIRRRRKLGYTLFNRQEGFAGPMQHMKDGGCLGVLVDQHSGDHGIWCPFFDRLASTTPIAALMAFRSHGLLVPMGIYDDGPGRWRMVCSAPVDTEEIKESVDGLTTWMNRSVEMMVRRQPENWFWVHNRWKTPKPRFLLDTYKRGISYPADYDQSKLQPFELLVRSPNWLGDACMALPSVRAMKAGRPDLKLTIFGPEKLRDLWEAQPEVSLYIGKETKESPFSAARKIKATRIHFDAGVLLTHSTRSTLELWLAGIPRLVGFKGSLRSKMLHQIIKEPKVQVGPLHHTLRYLHIAQSIGANLKKSQGTTLLHPDADSTTETSLQRIGICAGAEYGKAKRWPLGRFAEVIRQVASIHPEIEWVFFGAPGEAEMGTLLSSMVSGIKHTNLVGKTKLAELIIQLRTCRLLITNDTGTMHLACAENVPTVSIFGSTDPIATGPLGDHHKVIQHPVPCSPCFERECPFGHYDCMTKVTPENVTEAVLKRLMA